MSANTRYFVLYLGNQALAVLPTILLVRYGKDTFSTAWCAGFLLCVGWGTMGFGFADPALANRTWSMAPALALRLALRAVALCLIAVGMAALLPQVRDVLTAVARIDFASVTICFLLGLLRALAQTMSVFSIRLGRHALPITVQLVGRAIEIGLTVVGSLAGRVEVVVIAWSVYPLLQLCIGALQWRTYRDLPATSSNQLSCGSWGLILAGKALELLTPTVWLHLGGDVVFIAYRTVEAALSNSVLVPRYWFAITAPGHVRDRSSWALTAMVLLTSLAAVVVLQVATNAIPAQMLLGSMVALVFNCFAVTEMSRLRQKCLNDGDLATPALASGASCLAQMLLLALMRSSIDLAAIYVLAHVGFVAGLPVLLHATRTGGRRVKAYER